MSGRPTTDESVTGTVRFAARESEAETVDPVKPVLGPTEEVTVGGTTGSESVLARVDTGAARTSVDVTLAATLGAGPITGVSHPRTDCDEELARPVVDLAVCVGDDAHVAAARVEDRSDRPHRLLLGRDVLQGYLVEPEDAGGDP